MSLLAELWVQSDQTAQAYRTMDPELSNYSINMINESSKMSTVVVTGGLVFQSHGNHI